jgi:FkbM family methyltransferase
MGDIVSDYLNVEKGLTFFHDQSLWTDPFTVFINEEYKFLLGGTTIIDIGANIGDSSLYFALHGAQRIIAIEPFPQNFDLLVKNIEVNNIHNIIPLNLMLGNENKYVNLNIKREITTGVQAIPSDVGEKIQMVTLTEILDKYSVYDAYLKMDCEGCEYDSILLENKNTLRKFKKIQIEYHYGKEKLIEKLKNSGFKVKSTRTKPYFNRCADNPNMLLGYIYAERLSKV